MARDLSTTPPTGTRSRQISYADFEKAEIRVGRVVQVEPFPEARKPAYKLWLDFGELGIKRSSAQITARYQIEELIGRTILAVTNFPPKQVVDFVSEVLVLGVIVDEGDVVLIRPDYDVPPWSRVL